MNPLDLVDYAAFAAAAIGGGLVGRRMRPRPPAPLKPICSCSHGYRNHEDGRRCNGRIEEVSDWFNGKPDKRHMVQCTCLRYDGPDPAIFGLESTP